MAFGVSQFKLFTTDYQSILSCILRSPSRRRVHFVSLAHAMQVTFSGTRLSLGIIPCMLYADLLSKSSRCVAAAVDDVAMHSSDHTLSTDKAISTVPPTHHPQPLHPPLLSHFPAPTPTPTHHQL